MPTVNARARLSQLERFKPRLPSCRDSTVALRGETPLARLRQLRIPRDGNEGGNCGDVTLWPGLKDIGETSLQKFLRALQVLPARYLCFVRSRPRAISETRRTKPANCTFAPITNERALSASKFGLFIAPSPAPIQRSAEKFGPFLHARSNSGAIRPDTRRIGPRHRTEVPVSARWVLSPRHRQPLPNQRRSIPSRNARAMNGLPDARIFSSLECV